MNNNSKVVILIGIFVCVVMNYIEKVLMPGYWLKSILKIITFFGCIGLYCYFNKISIKKMLNISKPYKAKTLFFFVLLAYLTIIVSFFLFKDYLDLHGIRERLMAKEGLTRQNYLFIFAYVMICNSFIEESMFRGFLFRGLMENRKMAYLTSSLLFALYHIGIVDGWFNPAMFVVCIAGLTIAGIVLDYVAERYDSLFCSWLIHAFANFAINTIGAYIIFAL